jgi:phage gp37-like protein
MTAALQTAVIDLVRANFSRAELASVQAYGGEFSAGEVERVSYNAPAVFVAVLGWSPLPHSLRLTGRFVRGVRMAAFVVTKNVSREIRMAKAMGLAERLALLLENWAPTSTDAFDIGPLEAQCTVENLYGAAMDAKGQALWLVDWVQAVKPLVPPAALWDLLKVDITDTLNVPAAAATIPTPLEVAEGIVFTPTPPI